MSTDLLLCLSNELVVLRYELRTNQEAFAYGVGNIVASFFKSFPGSVALSRSAILDSVGGKSQIFGLISTGLLLFVCLLVGPLLRTLPNVSKLVCLLSN